MFVNRLQRHPTAGKLTDLGKPLPRSIAIYLPTLLISLLALAFSASPAVAAEPWWHVNTVSAPAAVAGGEGKLVVEVSNLGDARVDAAADGVTVVDTLPAGVSVTGVHGQGSGGGGIGGLIGEPNGSPFPCAIEEVMAAGGMVQAVRCTYREVLLAYERFMIAVTVVSAPGAGDGVNEVSVSGGGAPPVLSRRALALEDVGAPYGVESYEQTPEEEGGAPDTQAGSHPFQLTTTFTLNTRAVLVKHYNVNTNTEKAVLEAQPAGVLKDLRFDLPPGLVGNPTPLPTCPLNVFVRDSRECPQDTVVGVETPIVINVNVSSDVPMAPTEPLYSLDPAVGEPARFGFLEVNGPVILDTAVVPGGTGGYHVVVTVPDIPIAEPVIGSQTTFWGVPADARHDTTRGACLTDNSGLNPKGVLEKPEPACPVQEKPQPFLVLPTSCTGPLQTSLATDSWEEIGKFTEPFLYTAQGPAGEPLGQDGCNRLDFEPSITVSPDGRQGSTPTGLTVGVHVSQQGSLNPTGLAESTVKDTTVVLPPGVALDPSGGDGLLACGLGEIGLESENEQKCPEAAKVGELEIKTPLLPNPLVGAAYLATPAPFGEPGENPFNSLVALYLVAKDPVSGVLVKLAGKVSACEAAGQVLEGVSCQAPGQLISTFKNTPQLPFEDLKLHFFGGSRAPLATPGLCGSYSAQASIAPWSGNPASETSSPPFEIATGPDGSRRTCEGPLPFTPTLTTGSLNLQAGAFTPFTTTMSREDGEQTLQGIQLHFPPGVSGLLSGVKLCGEPQADEGTCGPESLIGETIVSVGVGSTPFSVKGGRVYITGPYNGTGSCTPGSPGCAPFGLSIVNPAKAGPFDLEKGTPCDCVVVRAKIEVDPATAALTISTDNTGPYSIPTILKGIPLQIKHVNVLITRPGFTFNPTNCNPMAVTGTLLSTEGASSNISVPFQVTNCATLKFTPKFQVSTSGKTSKANGASLSVKLTYPSAPFGSQANIKRVKVDLPKQLPSRLTTLQKACTAAQFETNPAGCPAASFIGHAKALTPLIPVPLEGPAIFVSHGGEAFPSLEVVLQGYGVKIDLVGSTFISKSGITSSTFKTVPDAPVGSFELTLPEGKSSALAANGNLCKSKLAMPTEFVAQNGDPIHESTKISVSGCPKTKKAKKHKHGKKAQK
jgi:uncharacterized repeat protein (TIGR01451 family)